MCNADSLSLLRLFISVKPHYTEKSTLSTTFFDLFSGPLNKAQLPRRRITNFVIIIEQCSIVIRSVVNRNLFGRAASLETFWVWTVSASVGTTAILRRYHSYIVYQNQKVKNFFNFF